MGFKYKNKKGCEYFLHEKKTKRGSTLRFFSKKSIGSIAKPSGFKVVESEKTGLPFLKRV